MTRMRGAWLAGAAVIAGALGWLQAAAPATLAPGQSVAVGQPPAAADGRIVVAAATGLQRTSRERAVTVTVTPLNLFDGGETLDFRVVLETHSVDLDYDLAQIAALRDDGGNVYRPLSWDGPKGGHHVTGVLRFKDGKRIVATAGDFLELEIRGVAGVPSRAFRWTLKDAR